MKPLFYFMYFLIFSTTFVKVIGTCVDQCNSDCSQNNNNCDDYCDYKEDNCDDDCDTQRDICRNNCNGVNLLLINLYLSL